jgi:hypothetical protein
MPYSEDKAKQSLVQLLRSKKAILFAGAGCSRFANYPDWDELVMKMKEELTPHLTPPAGIDRLQLVDIVKQQRISEGQTGEDAYYNFLRNEFCPKTAKFDSAFHLPLVQLGFCGIITTNYDRVLEDAVNQAYSVDGELINCQDLNLCDDDTEISIFKFMRELAYTTRPTSVLHLHGYYTKPRKIILSEADYQRHYKEFRIFDSSGAPILGAMDSLPRRILWSLLVMHSLVFVGFGMQDEAMMHVLRYIQNELKLGEEHAHFALIGYKTDEQREQTVERLKQKNITPVFYQIADSAGAGVSQDHSNLRTLVLDLAKEADTPLGIGKSVLDISLRTLGM